MTVIKKVWDWLFISLQDALLKQIFLDRDRDRDRDSGDVCFCDLSSRNNASLRAMCVYDCTAAVGNLEPKLCH